MDDELLLYSATELRGVGECQASGPASLSQPR